MAEVLYVVATPIGNLGDWSARAQEIVGGADLLLAEDTRHTRRLLGRYGLRVPMESYHDFNEEGRARQVLDRLRGGARVAMVSDSGTPGVSDPGYRLIRLCRQEGIPVLPIPGPSAAVAALSVSGLPTDAFYFVGFLPPKAGQRRRRLEDLRGIGATLVFYEAPHRVRGMLADLEAVLGDRTVSIAREMTKIHEEHLFGRLSEVRERVRPKGEFVVVVEGSGEPDRDAGDALDLEGLSRNELLKAIGERTGVGRKALYEALFRR